MAGWFSKIFPKAEIKREPSVLDFQNELIKANFREWQAQWHSFFDTDEDLIAAGEFDRPDPLPEDTICDFRLIFGLYHATLQTRQKCFALFPEGAEMLRRFEEFKISSPCPMSEVKARDILHSVVLQIEKIGPNEVVDLASVKVIDRDTESGRLALRSTDDITVLLERSLLEPHPDEDVVRVAARIFLTEPLYASAGNYYQMYNWVTAAMSGRAADELHTLLYELWCGGWQVRLDDEGVVLAQRKV